MVKKESLLDPPKFCQSGSAVQPIFGRLGKKMSSACNLSTGEITSHNEFGIVFVAGILSYNSFLPLSPPGWRGIVVTVRAAGRAGGRAGGCQTCGTHISVTAWWIFSVRSSMELSRPVVVHCHAHLPICPIWACPRAKNLSNLPQIGSRLCGSHISETAGWIYPI